MKSFHIIFEQENINLILILCIIIILFLLFRINIYCKKNGLQITLLKKQIDSQYKQIEAVQNTKKNINLKVKNEKQNEDFEAISQIVNARTPNLNSNLSSDSFDKIYDLVFNDLKQGKINHVLGTKISLRHGKIVFGNKNKSESKENMKLLFSYFNNSKKTNVMNLDRDDWFALISKLTKSKTNTIDYIYYRDFLQETLNRYKKLQ